MEHGSHEQPSWLGDFWTSRAPDGAPSETVLGVGAQPFAGDRMAQTVAGYLWELAVPGAPALATPTVVLPLTARPPTSPHRSHIRAGRYQGLADRDAGTTRVRDFAWASDPHFADRRHVAWALSAWGGLAHPAAIELLHDYLTFDTVPDDFGVPRYAPRAGARRVVERAEVLHPDTGKLVRAVGVAICSDLERYYRHAGPQNLPDLSHPSVDPAALSGDLLAPAPEPVGQASFSERRKLGRKVLHLLGAWPWAHAPNGQLPGRARADGTLTKEWLECSTFTGPLDDWWERSARELGRFAVRVQRQRIAKGRRSLIDFGRSARPAPSAREQEAAERQREPMTASRREALADETVRQTVIDAHERMRAKNPAES